MTTENAKGLGEIKEQAFSAGRCENSRSCAPSRDNTLGGHDASSDDIDGRALDVVRGPLGLVPANNVAISRLVIEGKDLRNGCSHASTSITTN